MKKPSEMVTLVLSDEDTEARLGHWMVVPDLE